MSKFKIFDLNRKQKEILISILDIALYLLHSVRGSIMFLDSDGVLRVRASRGMDSQQVKEIEFPLGIGIAGQVAQSGQAAVIPWTIEDNRFYMRVSSTGSPVRSLICVPIFSNSQVVGVMNIDNYDPGVFGGGQELRILTTLAGLIGEDLENFRVTSRLERSLTGLYKACQVNDKLQNGEEQQLYDWVTRLVGSVVEFERCCICLNDRTIYSWQAKGGNVLRDLNPVEPFGLPELILETCQPVLISNLDKHFQPKIRGRTENDRSYLAIPLLVEGETIGCLNLFHSLPGYYREEDLKTITVIVSLAELFYRSNTVHSKYRSYADKIINSIPSGVISLDLSDQILVFNRGAQNILKIEPHKVLGRKVFELGTGDSDFSCLEAIIREAKKVGTPKNGIELEINRADRVKINLALNISLWEENGIIRGTTIVFEDCTEKKKYEETLRYADRLASAGQLAAGIAHEIRNPLTTVKGFTQLYLTNFEQRPAEREKLELVLKEIESIEKIISELLAFSENNIAAMEKCLVGEMLDEILSLLRGEFILNGVAVKRLYAEEALFIYGDRAQLKRALLNIVLNSIQASSGGEVIISFAAYGNDKVKITVEDNGTGISPDNLAKVFDPFFTTKDYSTGLGLTVAAQIVKSHGGNINIKSVYNQGTTLELIFSSV